jgi:hypothetical protein
VLVLVVHQFPKYKYLGKWIPSPQESNNETSDVHTKKDVILVQKIRPVPRVCLSNLESEIRSTEGQGDVWISFRWMLREWVMRLGGL